MRLSVRSNIDVYPLLPSGLDKIEYLQNHSSEDIYRLAYRIIERYFSEEEEAVDLTIDPSKSSDGEQYNFSNSGLPEAGFHF